MPKPLWIVLANAAVAHCYERASRRAPLVLQATYAHPESRLHAKELDSDRPGRTLKDDAGRTSFVPRTEPRERERGAFARQLAGMLDEAVSSSRCSGIALFASNPFLGELQSLLSEGTRRHLVASHALDLTSFTGNELQARVDRVMNS